jgi:hypothetical protein
MDDDVTDGVNGRGAGKRKARVSASRKSYAEAESSEDDKPLVRMPASKGTAVVCCNFND